MSLDELQDFRQRYAAIVTASPALIEQVINTDNTEQLSLLTDAA
jgi:hypothetical protein